MSAWLDAFVPAFALLALGALQGGSVVLQDLRRATQVIARSLLDLLA